MNQIESSELNSSRIDYIDALRTVACFAVVMLHVSAQNTYNVMFQSHEWNIFMLYESIVNWAVPAFVMISGSLVLRKDCDFIRMRKKILRLVILFFIWSALYLLFDFVVYGVANYSENVLWLQVFLQGHYHMWYLIMLVGLYMIAPALKILNDNMMTQRAFVLFSLVLTFVVPSVKDLLQLSSVGGY